MRNCRARTSDAVLLTPAHQFPLGIALEHRAAFVRWARARRAVLVEDDYDGEFRYDRRPLGAMQALAPDHVVYGGTASKALAPAVGLAWLVPPEHLVGAGRRELTRIGARPAALNQLVLAEFLTSGRYDRHVRRSRLAYRRRRDRLVAALGDLPRARAARGPARRRRPARRAAPRSRRSPRRSGADWPSRAWPSSRSPPATPPRSSSATPRHRRTRSHGGGPARRDPQPIRRTSRTTTAVIAHQISAAVP